LQVLVGSWRANPLWAAGAGVGIIVGVAYTWRALQKAFFSDVLPGAHALEAEKAHPFAPITWAEIAGVALLGVSTIAVGVYPRILLDQIEPAVKTLLGGVQ
jgi:NADH-quinone oxidoreductase subunit M